MKVWVLTMVMVAVAGCTTSFDTLKEIRGTSGDLQAESHQEELLLEFAKGGQPPEWRAEAMKTMAHLDFEFMHRAHKPDLHRRLVDLLKREYLTPNCQKGSSAEDRYQLRAWSVHALAKCDRAKEIDFFAKVIEERKSNTDPKFTIRMATMDAILARKRVLAENAIVRRKVMAACASLKNEVKPRIALTPEAKSLFDAIMELETNLLSYQDSVALLPAKAIDYTDPGQIIQIMSWCERGIVSENAADVFPRVYAENIRKLLLMAEHPKLRIRRRARRMLSLYEPAKLFELLNSRVIARGIAPSEDVKDTIYMIGRMDGLKSTLAPAEWVAYQKTRRDVPARFFANVQKYPVETRDYVMSRLLLTDLQLFADLCAEQMKTFKKETPRNAHVYARNLFHGLLRSTEVNPKLRKELVDLLASFADSPYLPTRRLVTHALYRSNPEELLMANLPMFKDLKNWDPVKTDELVDSYLAALMQLERDADRSKRFQAKFRKDVGKSIYQPLADSVTQRIGNTNAKLAEFLRVRDPDVFLTSLANTMLAKRQANKSKSLQETVLLGDLALRTKAKIQPATLKTVSKTLTRGVVGRNEEESLLCARYLLELGETLDDATLMAAPLVVRKLNALKLEVVK